MKKKAVPNVLLRQARIQRNWSQRRLAEKVGVDEQTVGSWERGTRFPSLEMRQRLCDLFEKTPEELGLQLPDEVLHSQELSVSPSLSDEPVSPSLTEGRGSGQERIISLQIVSSPLENTSRDENRRLMLQRVRSLWITGVFDHSLYHEMLITLGLQEQPDAVKNPWHLVVQETNMPPRSLPAGTRITQVYDDAGGQLLILGVPGAGKTTLLLELARDLLDRAEDDEIAPIPVIFTLSSWAEKQLPLAAWMIEELQSKYQVPRQLAHSWVRTDRILPLLDGLDEVHEAQLPACIEAINRYRQEHGLLPMVVCSRSDNYFAQQARILLRTAVVVQPLTREQIDAYITSAGESLKALQVALQNDPILQEIASNPLFLTILAHTYHDLPREDVCVGAASVLQRRAVLERYVQRVLQHRKASKHYTAQQTKRWLSWLARQETERGQTEFYIERMQPDWLADSQMRHRYQKTVVRLVYGIESLVIAALFAWLRGGKLGNSIGVGAGLLGQLGGGVGNSVLGWMAPGLGGGLEGGGSLGIIIAIITVILTLLISTPLSLLTMKAMLYGLSNGARRGLVIGGLVGLFSVVVFTLSDGLQIGLSRGAGAGLFAGLLTTLMIGLLTALRSDQVSSHMPTAPSNQKQAQSKMGTWRERLIDVGVLSLCAGIGSGTVEAALVGLNQNVFIYASIIGLFFGMALGLVGGTELIPGLGQTIMPIETTTWSWDSVRQHLGGNLSKGLIIGLPISVLMIVTIGCISGFFYGASYGLRYGLVYGLIIGVIGAVASVLAGILTSGWSGDMLDEHQLFRPNEGIRRSTRNAVFAASIFGPLGGLASGLICGTRGYAQHRGVLPPVPADCQASV